MDVLKAPFPYFGGKSRIAPMVWERFGKVANYVEPFLALVLFSSHAPTLGIPKLSMMRMAFSVIFSERYRTTPTP